MLCCLGAPPRGLALLCSWAPYFTTIRTFRMQPGQEAAALNAGGLPPTDDSALQGWDRLQKLFGYAFARHDPSARVRSGFAGRGRAAGV